MVNAKVALFCAVLLNFASYAQQNSFKTRFEISNKTESASYFEGIKWWNKLDSAFSEVRMQEFGMTDAGYPLQIVTLSSTSTDWKTNKNKSVILINNAIHPGEPDGVDASMLLFRDILFKHQQLLDSCFIVCIPYYNIGGALNRNNHSRANQLGPVEYGFRGNAQNLDLNRDFVKCDSRNAQSFAKLLQLLDPDVYIETHVSNGADYRYNITYLSTQPDKIGGVMGTYLRFNFIPGLEKKMATKNNEMVPYVNHHSGPLLDSYTTFYDSPRYSSGLTTLHSIYGFITETHMLKPFEIRVISTFDYLLSSIEYCSEHSSEIKQSRQEQKHAIANAKSFALDWKLDETTFNKMKFKGYEHGYKKSKVTGANRLYYDRSKPITKSMDYYGYMIASKERNKPKAYLLKRGFVDVEERLRWNNVALQELTKDTVIEVVSYLIYAFDTKETAYEKHYFHSNSLYTADTISWTFRKGDYLIKTGTDKDRFVVEMLEPDGPDSYFNWNFFDAILQQKEWYSPYVFEDKAAEYLRNNNTLNQQFLAKKEKDKDFANNARAQLHWVYTQSQNYEKEHRRLPIFRIE